MQEKRSFARQNHTEQTRIGRRTSHRRSSPYTAGTIARCAAMRAAHPCARSDGEECDPAARSPRGKIFSGFSEGKIRAKADR